MAEDLTARLEETARRILDEMARQFATVREETNRQFAEAREERNGQIQELRQEMLERFDGVDERIRLNRVLIEDLRSDLQGVAEGVVMVNEKLDRREAERISENRDLRTEMRFLHRRSEQRNDEQDARLDAREAAEG